jgi:hypothetical protein
MQGRLFVIIFAGLAVASATAISAAAAAPAPAPAPPGPGPAEKWDWRLCDEEEEGGGGKGHRHSYTLAVDSVCLDPFPIVIGEPWGLWVGFKHAGTRTLHSASVTMRIFALKHLLVYSTTEDLCRSSKKKNDPSAASPRSFVNVLAFRNNVLAAHGGDDGEGNKGEGCPLHAGEESVLHLGGTWTSWAPESDKYVLRVMVHSEERPHPTNELMCIDIDVVARKPPSSLSAEAAAVAAT